MATSIDKNRLDMRRIEQEMKWEPWKAAATVLVATAAVIAGTLALNNYFRPSPQTVNVRIQGKL